MSDRLDAVSYKPDNTPPEQDYYWTEEWQTGERESLAELAAGKGIQFETAEEAIRWLMGPDDDVASAP